jgi:hypothetical protein
LKVGFLIQNVYRPGLGREVVAKVNFKVKLHFQTDDITIKDNLRKLIKIPSYRDEALKLRGKVTKASFANLTTNEQNILKRYFNNAENLRIINC